MIPRTDTQCPLLTTEYPTSPYRYFPRARRAVTQYAGCVRASSATLPTACDTPTQSTTQDGSPLPHACCFRPNFVRSLPSVSVGHGHTSTLFATYYPLTPIILSLSPEDSRWPQRSMCKDGFGEPVFPVPKNELEGMIHAISAPGVVLKELEQEVDPSRESPARTSTWSVTEVLGRSRTSINVRQVALVYVVDTKRVPQHVREALPVIDWLRSGSRFRCSLTHAAPPSHRSFSRPNSL